MIPLSLRLTVQGGREAVVRLVLLVLAVGLGTGLLLAAIAGINAVNTQNQASAWLWTGNQVEPAGPPAAGNARLWWHISADMFAGQSITRVDVAATGAAAPVPPGIARDPGPGQYYASPALAALLRGKPADELADRYPGRLAGTIGEAALPSPASLVIIVGHTPAQLARTSYTVPVTAIASTWPGGFARRFNPHGLSIGPPVQQLNASGTDLVLSVVALAILTPVLIFIATATRLSAARREQRFAAMRLVGATRRQISMIAAVESTVAAAGGMAIGFGLFFLLRVPLASIPFTGEPFFPAQMSLSVLDIVAVAAGIPVAAAVAARFALRRVQISPLGVARRGTPKPPAAWRLIPLLAGVSELSFFVVHGRPATVSGQVQAYFPGILLVVIGLIVAGPWLTMTAARFLARRARRPGALVAARRLADDPHAAFRAISGLVLALFVTTVAVALLSTNDATKTHRDQTVPAANVLTDQLTGAGDLWYSGLPAAPPPTSVPWLARVRGIGGVTGVVEVYADAKLTIRPNPHGAQVSAGLVSCAQLAKVPSLGRCPAGAAVAGFPVALNTVQAGTIGNITWPAEPVPAQRLPGRGVDALNVATNGSQQAIERARTVLASAYPLLAPPQTIGEQIAQNNAVNDAYQQLTDVVILTSLVVAGCTLAASIAAGLADRKRPFSMLRLTGARLGTLRRVVVLESAVPLLAVAVVAIGAGFAAAALYASSEMKHSLVPPGAGYYLFTAAGIAMCLVIIAATFPLLRRITGPEVARNE